MNYYPEESDINTIIAAAQPSDIVYLPDDVITSQVVIGTDCTVIGQESTLIDVRGLSINRAVEITGSGDISNFSVKNDTTSGHHGVWINQFSGILSTIDAHCDIAFNISSSTDAEFTSLIADGANTGYLISNSFNNEFLACEARSCDTGFDLVGSSSIVGDTNSYQEMGLSFSSPADDSSLVADTYYFSLDGTEYSFAVSSTPFSYAQLLTSILTASDGSTTVNQSFHAEIMQDDIRIIRLTSGSVSLSAGTSGTDLLASLGTTPDSEQPGEMEENRTDRTHHNVFSGCASHMNKIGIRLVNANHNQFVENCRIFDNTNIGMLQAPVSYSNVFRGEIIGNGQWGMRNTDKQGQTHDVDATSVWWGDITGPSGGGPGNGDRISNYVLFKPWLQNGTQPELSYPETRDWIWSMLGGPLVRVELTEEQITDDIEVAIDKFMYYWTPEPYYWYADLGAGQQEVMLPLEIPKDSVIEITYQPHSDLFAQLSGSGESFFLTYYLQKTGGTFLADFYIAMSYKETFERALGIVPSYEFITHPQDESQPYDPQTNPYRDFIRVYPLPDINSVKLGVKVSRQLTEEEVDNEFWIRKYALSWAKEQLGRVRGKFQSIPGPTGEIAMNGSELIAEAQQEREQHIRSLITRSEPLGFTTG